MSGRPPQHLHRPGFRRAPGSALEDLGDGAGGQIQQRAPAGYHVSGSGRKKNMKIGKKQAKKKLKDVDIQNCEVEIQHI